jgi:hypothetical protein
MNHKHGHRHTKLYNSWLSMRRRCHDVNHIEYPRYGAKGIVVCDNWKNSFIDFMLWAYENNYVCGLQIDRINNDLGYFPENCRWVTAADNARNRRFVKLDEQKVKQIKERVKEGELQVNLSKEYGVCKSTINRIVLGKNWK